ncbi:MAG: hypothetical protein H0W78_00695 [Planctomycetes bacterium]|nr:hypothetical protein [Planctomycetota bacterium]
MPLTDHPNEELPELLTSAHALVLVQADRVICVVEGHRQEAARSVAHLICRLLQHETCVYACAAQEAATLTADLPLPAIPPTWSELYRAIPWADTAVGIR